MLAKVWSFTSSSVGARTYIKAKVIAALLTGMAMLMTSPAWATTITFDLSSCAQAGLSPTFCPNKDAGTNTITYHSGGQMLTATGNKVTASTDHLYLKQAGSGEIGLGLAADTVNHEIQSTDFVTLDLSSLFAAGFTTATVKLESIQSGEGGDVCQGSSRNLLGSVNCTDLDNPPGGVIQSATFNLTPTTDVLSITADTGNVLVANEVSVATVPEPGSLALFGSGLLGLCAMLRRRFKIAA